MFWFRQSPNRAEARRTRALTGDLPFAELRDRLGLPRQPSRPQSLPSAQIAHAFERADRSRPRKAIDPHLDPRHLSRRRALRPFWAWSLWIWLLGPWAMGLILGFLASEVAEAAVMSV
jgi:hypothetical protein